MLHGNRQNESPRTTRALTLVLALVLALALGTGVAAQEGGDVNILAHIPEEEVISYSPPINVLASAGGSGNLSAPAQALVNGLSAQEQPVAQRGLSFVEAVLAGDAGAVASHLHPEVVEMWSTYGGMSATEIAQFYMDMVYWIVGPNPTGYERVNIDLYYGGYADCDVYFQVADDFLVVEMMPYNGSYYVYSMY